MPHALIAGAFQTGVLGVRSLHRKGVRARMVDSNPSNAGFQSIYGPALLCPDPDRNPEEWARFMLDLGRSRPDRTALIASSDKFVTAISRFAEPLSEVFILTPGTAIQGLLADKKTQYELAAAHGMPMPVTAFAKSIEDVEHFAKSAVFPCLVKPTHFREWEKLPADNPLFRTKVAIAETREKLLECYRLAAAATTEVILQEIIEGPDSGKRVYLSCYDSASRRIANALFRELRCDPIGFGPASVSEPVVDAETDEICDSFLKSISYVGLCEIEMKRDTRDGRVKLIEANPRLSGGGDAAPYAGVDLCWIHYCDLVGIPVAAAGPSGKDFRHIVLRSDAAAVPTYWRAGLLGWRELLRSYRPPIAFYDLDWRDWRYSLETLFISARTFLRYVLAPSAPKSEK